MFLGRTVVRLRSLAFSARSSSPARLSSPTIVLVLDSSRRDAWPVRDPLWATSLFPVRGPRIASFRAKTERAGFEPAMEFDPHTRLAGECLQPLGPLSRRLGARFSGCGIRAGP